MPLNGSGSYSAPASSWNPAVDNTDINSTDWAALLADLSTAISTALFKDGQQTPTANIPMGGFKLTGLAAGTANGNSVRYEQSPAGLLTAKGGIISASAANTPSVLAVGSDVSMLVAASGQTTGLNWQAMATQADQETSTSVAAPVTPGRQQFHPSAAKVWALWDTSSGTPTVNASYNVTSFTDNGVGDATVNFTTAFSSANYAVVAGCGLIGTGVRFMVQGSGSDKVAGSVRIVQTNSGTTAVDAVQNNIACFGDQ